MPVGSIDQCLLMAREYVDDGSCNVRFREAGKAVFVTDKRRKAVVAASGPTFQEANRGIRLPFDLHDSAQRHRVQDGLHVLFQVEFAPCLNG